MTQENIDKLPLAVLRDLHALVQQFDDLYKKNSDIILRNDDKHGDVLQFKNSFNENFEFIITNPRIENRIINYTCKLCPSSELSFDTQVSHGDAKNLPRVFQRWISIMTELDKYRTLLSEPFLKEYTDEFFTEFEFVEEEVNPRLENYKELKLNVELNV